MAANFTEQIKQAERTIDYYQRNNQPVPVRVLYIYETLKSLDGSTSNQNNSGSSSGSNSGSESNSSNYNGSLNPGSYPTISTTSSVILSADEDREYVLIQNTGDETAFIEFNGAAVVNQGIKIVPGGSWSSDIDQFTQSQMQAIVETNTTTLTIYTIS